MFMIPLDIAYVISVWQMIDNAPLYYISIGHLLINPFLLFTDMGFQRVQYETFRVVYVLLLGLNVLMMIVQLQSDIRNFKDVGTVYIYTVCSHGCESNSIFQSNYRDHTKLCSI